MKNFLIIDNKTGYVWGQAEAETPIDAVRQIDTRINTVACAYVAAPQPDSADESGFHVYDGSVLVISQSDGQDPAVIARVQAQPYFGYFRQDLAENGALPTS